MQQHLLFFRIIIQQVDPQIRTESVENRENFFFKFFYGRKSFRYKYILRKRKLRERSTAKASFYKQLPKIHLISTTLDSNFL
jgi:hypothetical protein